MDDEVPRSSRNTVRFKEPDMFKPTLAASLVMVAGAAALTEVLAAYAQAV
jgi:hypothetical protein